MYWSGSHAKFYGVTWEGADTKGLLPWPLNTFTTDYHSNVFNAFNTAPLLNDFLNSLNGTNIVAAHSLGNMVVLSTLNDYSNQTINAYFMVDAAAPLEAIEGVGANASTYVVHSDWNDNPFWEGAAYPTNVWASYWHSLFPSSDYRSQLTWDGRLSNLQDASVYNFYSSGEEVLRTYKTRPTPSFAGAVLVDKLEQLWSGDVPVQAYVWNLQELFKGELTVNDILGSDHGGWKFNAAYGTNIYGEQDTYWLPMSPQAAAQLTPAQLQAAPFFDLTSGPLPSAPNFADTNLLGSSGSAYAQANLNRILSDAIPALTLPIGANPVTVQNIVAQNTDMMTLENGWPESRLLTLEGNNWWHDDFREVAYTFTYKLFDQLVALGNLK
jgi:hypothetical protein